MIYIAPATPDDLDEIVSLLDRVLTASGYGFCNSAQVNTELKRGSVFVARDDAKIIGVRIGFDTIYNLAVDPTYRNMGVGKKLVHCYDATFIRVKSQPVGHLSIAQKEGFINPEPFYEKIGFIFSHTDFGKNFFQNTSGKAKYHKKGSTPHIRIFRNKKQTTITMGD